MNRPVDRYGGRGHATGGREASESGFGRDAWCGSCLCATVVLQLRNFCCSICLSIIARQRHKAHNTPTTSSTTAHSPTYQLYYERQHREHDRAASRPAGGRRKDRYGSLPDGDHRTPQVVAAGPRDEKAQQDGCSVQGTRVPRPQQPVAGWLKVSRPRCAVERL